MRELENAIRYAAIKSQGMPILSKHLPPQVSAYAPAKPAPVRNRKLDEDVVRDALEVTKGNKSEAARHLGVSRATLYRFLSEFSVAI